MNRAVTGNAGDMPVLGQGTWEMGSDRDRRKDEIRALQLGIDLGMTLIDTAEMYASGGAEEVTGEAIRGRRDEVYLVTKVLPSNASRKGTVRAAEQSLKRLGTDVIDLYLLHWTGSHPIQETIAGFEDLRTAGKIRHWGVSNFDVDDLEEAAGTSSWDRIGSNQILYNLAKRGPETAVIPLCRKRGVTVMAYSPVDQGALQASDGLRVVAERHGVSPYCAAIAWTIREPGVVTIPKSAREDHVRDNAKAASIDFSSEDLALLDRDFPRPSARGPLETG